MVVPRETGLARAAAKSFVRDLGAGEEEDEEEEAVPLAAAGALSFFLSPLLLPEPPAPVVELAPPDPAPAFAPAPSSFPLPAVAAGACAEEPAASEREAAPASFCLAVSCCSSCLRRGGGAMEVLVLTTVEVMPALLTAELLLEGGSELGLGGLCDVMRGGVGVLRLGAAGAPAKAGFFVESMA